FKALGERHPAGDSFRLNCLDLVDSTTRRDRLLYDVIGRLCGQSQGQETEESSKKQSDFHRSSVGSILAAEDREQPIVKAAESAVNALLPLFELIGHFANSWLRNNFPLGSVAGTVRAAANAINCKVFVRLARVNP